MLAADIVSAIPHINGIHNGGEGANTTRLDGSVQWVDRAEFDQWLTPSLSSVFADQLWTALDQAN